MQHLCGDDLDSTIDLFSGSVPLGLCEGSMLRKAPIFVSIVLNLSLTDMLSPLLCEANAVLSRHKSVEIIQRLFNSRNRLICQTLEIC